MEKRPILSNFKYVLVTSGDALLRLLDSAGLISSLTRSTRKMFKEISNDEHSDMDHRLATFAKTVVSIGVDHVIKRLSEFNQPIDQSFDDLNVSVRFAGPGDHQQFTFQTVCKVDWCR